MARARSSYTAEELAARDRARLRHGAKCKRDAKGCLIWLGYASPEGVPMATMGRGRKTAVRAELWRLDGRALPRRAVVRCRLGEPYCVALEHLELRRSPTEIPLAEIAALAELRAAGKTYAEIAAVTRLKMHTVVNRLRKWRKEVSDGV